MAFEKTLAAIQTANQEKPRDADRIIDRETLNQILQVMFTEINTAIDDGGTGGEDALPLAGGTMAGTIDMDFNTVENGSYYNYGNGLELSTMNIVNPGEDTLSYSYTPINNLNDNSLIHKKYVDDAVSGWGLEGNAGTVADTNFIGTTDNIPLEFKVNGQRVGFISTATLLNVSFGYQALNPATTGTDNVALGPQTLFSNISGDDNTGTGHGALQSNTTGNNNTANGAYSLYGTSTGGNNIGVGYYAGQNITSGSNNISIGASTSVAVATNDNQIRMGNASITLAQIEVAWTVTSDKQFKNTIQNSDLGLDFITKLNPVSYLRNNDTSNKTEYGFIAQELEEALEDVGVTNSGIITKDDEGMLSLRYNDLLAPLVKSIQELKAENEALNARITALEA